MARLDEIQGKKIALDTVVFIYALEGNNKFGINTGCEIFITNDTAMKCDIASIDIWLISEIDF